MSIEERDAVVPDRRDGAVRRVHFESLVEVGAGSTGGFEAESLDVSPEGMRLRTAYLPEKGETIVCRFDGVRGEVVAEGEVAWCRSAERGGEFGVRFTRMDEHGASLLQDMCAASAAAGKAVAIDPSAAQPGARVRLHIQGLGSPMRARVREVATGEVLIGSNLEFLKVGRGVELEEVEQRRRRVAQIEHVTVEIDPENQVPQLVVALRYEDVAAMEEEIAEAGAGDPTTAPLRVRTSVVEERETTPEPSIIDRAAAIEPVQAQAAFEHAPATLATPEAPACDDIEVDEAAAERSGLHFSAVGRAVRPRIASIGTGAAGVLGRIFAAVKQKRVEHAMKREERQKLRAPKRTTAPPPTGALRSDGRRLFRETPAEPEAPQSAPIAEPKRSDKKRAVIGIAIGVAVVLGVYVAAGQISARAPKGEPLAAVAPEPAAATAAPADPQAAASPIATADIPLFGATPLSTTEPVPVPPAIDAEEADAPQAAEPAAGGQTLVKDWGVGQVRDPVVLRLKMDDTVEGVVGTETATGFTVTVPNRKSISSASGLARKDKRLDSVNVVNYPDRAEISVQFKGEVPAFAVKVQGKKLVIELTSAKGKPSHDDADEEPKPKKSKTKKSDKPKADAKSKPEAKSEAKSDAKSDAKADAKPAAKSDDKAKPPAKKKKKKSDAAKPANKG